MSRMRSFALVFGVVGLLVPLAILAAKNMSATGFSPSWIYYAWPSYFILGGLAGAVDYVTVVYLSVSILLNMALYAYIGFVLGRILRNAKRPEENAASVNKNV